MSYPQHAGLVLVLIDISRAHLGSPTIREIYVNAPVEDTECPEGHCWILHKIFYGQRDAGKAFDLNCQR
eukprot:396765-Karenia_brevis.AAC.1